MIIIMFNGLMHWGGGVGHLVRDVPPMLPLPWTKLWWHLCFIVMELDKVKVLLPWTKLW